MLPPSEEAIKGQSGRYSNNDRKEEFPSGRCQSGMAGITHAYYRASSAVCLYCALLVTVQRLVKLVKMGNPLLWSARCTFPFACQNWSPRRLSHLPTVLSSLRKPGDDAPAHVSNCIKSIVANLSAICATPKSSLNATVA
jgi:hypothetical protein